MTVCSDLPERIQNEVIEFYEEKKSRLNTYYRLSCKKLISDIKKDHKEALNAIREIQNLPGKSNYMIETTPYYLTLNGQYEDAINLCHELIGTLEKEDNDVVFVNLCHAKQLMNSDLDRHERTRLQNIMAKSQSYGARACAEILLGNSQQAGSNLAKAIKDSLKSTYHVRDWKILENSSVYSQAIKILSSEGYKIIDTSTAEKDISSTTTTH